MLTITHAIDTRPFFLLSVLLEKKRPGNEASLDLASSPDRFVSKITTLGRQLGLVKIVSMGEVSIRSD